MKTVLIIGANSTIAQALARQIVTQSSETKTPVNFFLVGRDAERLQANAADLSVRGAKIETFQADLTDISIHTVYLEQATSMFGFIHEIYVVHGFLGDQNKAKTDLGLAMEIVNVNYTSVVALSTALLRFAERKLIGDLAIFSSVAGDRGRYSNYVYGSAMAGKSALISGLRAQLYRSGTHVMTVKPGFVDTRMTAEFKKGALWASPTKVADQVITSLRKKKDVCYTPGFWRLIMLIIIHIPERIFKRLSL
jgi:decaprenylphospho-beta-D-erythro-pentofuranosid-2-ulose 2-reductase